MEHDKTPKVIVLVLSYNVKNLLNECIDSYLQNQYPNFEVIVIDNGSTDGTEEYVKSNWPNVKLIRTNINLKYSGGFNLGLAYAFNQQKVKYVVITNNDVKAGKNLISALVEVAENQHQVAFVTGKVYYYDNPSVFQTVGKNHDSFWWNGGHIGRNEKDEGQYDKIRELSWCDDIYWLVTKEIYNKTGGYDTEFKFQGEDFDWQARAKKEGYKIYYTPKAKLWHKESMTIGKTSPFKAYFDARNPLIVQMRHRTKNEYIPVIRERKKQYIKASIKYILKGRFKMLFKVWLGYYSAIRWGKRNNKI